MLLFMAIIEREQMQCGLYRHHALQWSGAATARRGELVIRCFPGGFHGEFFSSCVCLVLSPHPHSFFQKWPKQREQRLQRSLPVSYLLRSLLFVACSHFAVDFLMGGVSAVSFSPTCSHKLV